MAIKLFNVMDLGKAGLIEPEKLGYQDSIEIIKDESFKVQKSFVKIGWYLKHIRDNELYKEAGYASVWECAVDQLGYSQSTASRFINICEKFSKGHDSPELDAKYEGFDKSQMIEMLPMEQEQLDKVTPDMTVKQIRDIKMENKVSKEEQEQTADDDIPGQTSIEKDFPEYLPEGKRTKEIRKTESYATSHKENDFCPSLANTDAEVKMKPIVKGLLDDPYCARCQISLNGPEIVKCPSCGQMLDWSEYIEYFENDTTETSILMEKEKIIDGEYREVDEPAPEEKNLEASQLHEEEKLSPYGLPKRVYPEGSLLTTVGCGNRYDCFGCAQDCAIRQEDRYCREAPMGNPFNCTTMQVLENIKAELGERCPFNNFDIAEHTSGSNEPDPCCKNCNDELCGYRCQRSMINKEPKELVSLESMPENDLSVVKYILEQEKKNLDDYLKVGGLPEMTVLRQKTIVVALAAMVCDLEITASESDPEPESEQQPELPVLKNNDQRKEWLANYKAWGIWYHDEHIDVNYYKYDFSDGSRLVVAEYPQRYEYWSDKRSNEHYFHLLEKNKKSYKKKSYDEQFRNRIDAETDLVEFLKNLQKKEGK